MVSVAKKLMNFKKVSNWGRTNGQTDLNIEFHSTRLRNFNSILFKEKSSGGNPLENRFNHDIYKYEEMKILF